MGPTRMSNSPAQSVVDRRSPARPGGMSPPGRPKGEYRSAQREGTLMSRPAVPKAHTVVRSTEVA